MLTAVMTFEMITAYAKYRKSTPAPLGPAQWIEKYYPDNISRDAGPPKSLSKAVVPVKEL